MHLAVETVTRGDLDSLKFLDQSLVCIDATTEQIEVFPLKFFPFHTDQIALNLEIARHRSNLRICRLAIGQPKHNDQKLQTKTKHFTPSSMTKISAET